MERLNEGNISEIVDSGVENILPKPNQAINTYLHAINLTKRKFLKHHKT